MAKAKIYEEIIKRGEKISKIRAELDKEGQARGDAIGEATRQNWHIAGLLVETLGYRVRYDFAYGGDYIGHSDIADRLNKNNELKFETNDEGVIEALRRVGIRGKTSKQRGTTDFIIDFKKDDAQCERLFLALEVVAGKPIPREARDESRER